MPVQNRLTAEEIQRSIRNSTRRKPPEVYTKGVNYLSNINKQLTGLSPYSNIGASLGNRGTGSANPSTRIPLSMVIGNGAGNTNPAAFGVDPRTDYNTGKGLSELHREVITTHQDGSKVREKTKEVYLTPQADKAIAAGLSSNKGITPDQKADYSGGPNSIENNPFFKLYQQGVVGGGNISPTPPINMPPVETAEGLPPQSSYSSKPGMTSNDLAYILSMAAQAVMGRHQDSWQANLGRGVGQMVQSSEFGKAVRNPGLVGSSMALTPEMQMAVATTTSQIERDRLANEQVKAQTAGIEMQTRAGEFSLKNLETNAPYITKRMELDLASGLITNEMAQKQSDSYSRMTNSELKFRDSQINNSNAQAEYYRSMVGQPGGYGSKELSQYSTTYDRVMDNALQGVKISQFIGMRTPEEISVIVEAAQRKALTLAVNAGLLPKDFAEKMFGKPLATAPGVVAPQPSGVTNSKPLWQK